MSDYQFKVGDKGKTRDGRPYEVLSTCGWRTYNGIVQPITARITEADGCELVGYFYPDGGFMDTPCRLDLMPPEQPNTSPEQPNASPEQPRVPPELQAALGALLEARRAEAAAEKAHREALSHRVAAQSKFDAEFTKAVKAK